MKTIIFFFFFFLLSQKSFALTGEICITGERTSNDNYGYFFESPKMCYNLKKAQKGIKVLEITLLGATAASACGAVTLPATLVLGEALVVVNIVDISINVICEDSETVTPQAVEKLVCDKFKAAGIPCDDETRLSVKSN